jgi:rfaE bifunctional protein nucleotidyltransferase chain/domain
MTEPRSPKIVAFADARAHCDALRAQGRRIVQSHGIYDLIHPGHIAHLQGARALGDVLVVSVPSDPHVHKGPGRPYFTEQLRLRSLAAFECVDFVVLVPHSGALEAIEAIRPSVFCRGKEYEDPEYDDSGSLQEEKQTVERMGGVVRFAGAIKFSSTKLLNLYFEHPTGPIREFCTGLAETQTRKSFSEAVESLASLRVLVVGEAIFDRYSTVRVQGLTSKNRILSGRFLNQETQCGGALAAFRHVRQFTPHARFLSVVGTEPWVNPFLAQHLRPEEDLVLRDARSTTIVKERFVEPRREDAELSKLFSVNYLDPDPPAPDVQEDFERRFRQAAAECDAVLLLDFGHGLLQPRLRELIQDVAPFLVLNCQTNSNNHGFNILPRQYHRAHVFTLDEQEILLAVGHRQPDFQAELARLKSQLGAHYAWLTRGPIQTLGLFGKPKDAAPAATLCPTFEPEVVDTVGAGDAFFSVAGLAAARNLPLDLATFMGQLAGAQAVRIVGNARPISKPILIKSGMSLLER